MSAAPSLYPGRTLPGPGQVSMDHGGSYDEWYEWVVADLIDRYTKGLGGMGSDDPSLGRPAPEDMGSAAAGGGGGYSFATVSYWQKFVSKYGATDPFVSENYGAPPDRRATYTADPNSSAALNDASNAAAAERTRMGIEDNREARGWESGENQKDRDWKSSESAADRAFQSGEAERERTFLGGQADLDRALAREREGNETGRIRMQIESNEKMSLQDDITRRWIAEGDWGVQRYVTDTQEAGQLARLQLQLGLRREEMAQEAEAEENRHHEVMSSLVLQVAQYDAELAAQPVNWLKYAAWLSNRGQVVDGLTLAMASELVPEESITTQELAESSLPGTNIAAVQTYEEQMASGQNAIQEVTDPNAGQAATGAMQGTNATTTNATTATADPYQYKNVDMNNRNYGDMFNQIIGMNPGAAQNGVDNSPEAIQGTLNMLDTTGANASTAGAGGGGVQLNGEQYAFNADGSQNDIRKFAALGQNKQAMAAGAVAGAGNTFTQFLEDMKKAAPKGGQLQGATGYG